MDEQRANRPLERVASLALVTLVGVSSFHVAPSIVAGIDPGLDPTQAGGGSAITQLLFSGLFAAVAASLLIFRRSDVLYRTPRAPLWILAWCWLSLLWATDADASIRRLVYTTMVILTLSYIVEILPYDRLMRLLAATLALIVVADWAAVLLLPSATHGMVDPLDPNSGWRGLHMEKNEAGGVLANCLIFFVFETARTKSRLTGPLLCVASAVFLIETHSKTSIGFVGVSILAGVICASTYVKIAVRCVMLLVFVVIVLTSIGASGFIWQQLGLMLDDPAGFTGRSQIWTALLAYAHDHLLFGSGYGSFWDIGDESPIFAYSNRAWLAVVYEAHDGYMELLVNVGLIGLVAGVFDLVIRPLWVVFTRPLVTGVSRGMACALVTFACLHNLLESTFLNRANPSWVLAALTYAVLFKVVAQASVPQPSTRDNTTASPLAPVQLAEQ